MGIDEEGVYCEQCGLSPLFCKCANLAMRILADDALYKRRQFLELWNMLVASYMAMVLKHELK